MRKIAAVILLIFIMSVVSSCGKSSGSSSAVKPTSPASQDEVIMGTGKISLYFSLSDSLNPYTALSTGNQQLTSLLFDPLVKLDINLNPQNVLASDVKIDGKKCIVTLKSAVFTDGTAVTAEDVTFSIKQARNSENGLYKSQLENIYSYNAASSSVVEITMKKSDPNFARLLDFPIIKSGSTDRENSDKKGLPPIGSGRYVYKDDNGVFSLVPNKNYITKSPRNTISLVNTPDSEVLDFNIKTGAVDICYTPAANGNLPSMGGGISMVKQTNLVYLGINSNRSALKSKNIRLAVSNLLNRSDICETAYYTYAEPALSPYPIGVNFANKWQNMLDKKENVKKSIEHLANSGYNKKDNDGYYVDSKGVRIKLSLLYNSDNVFQTNAALMIVKQMKSGGIEVTAVPANRAQYAALVKSANYDFYLGEIKLNKNFDFTNMLSKELVAVKTTAKSTKATTTIATTTAETLSSALTSVSAQPTTQPEKIVEMNKTYESYLKGDISFDEFMNEFASQMPFVPICYRLGVVSFSSQITPNAAASVSDAYYNIELLSVK